jgi:hypothetical protein
MSITARPSGPERPPCGSPLSQCMEGSTNELTAAFRRCSSEAGGDRAPGHYSSSSAAGAVRGSVRYACSRAGASVVVSRLTPRDRHTSPNQSYGTPPDRSPPKCLLRAMGVAVGFLYPDSCRCKVTSVGRDLVAGDGLAHRDTEPLVERIEAVFLGDVIAGSSRHRRARMRSMNARDSDRARAPCVGLAGRRRAA